jgi:esterase/lipase superfamily enzyme
MKYVCHRYHVSEDGSDLAAKVQQADPTRPPLGYGGEPLREPSPYIDSIVTQLAEVETAQAEKEEEDDLPKRAGAEIFVRVHYATDRALAGRTGPNHYYGSERGDLRYGYAIVSIPAGHAMGEMERPTIWRMEFRENVESHVVLRDLRELDHTQFFDELHSEIEHTKESAAFVFIHGFNVTFAAAARRAAQMAYDLFLIGPQRGLATLSTVPILYSWPSKGGLLRAGDYFHDAADSEASGGGHLKAFLNEVATLSGAASLTIVAHSMGCRALTTALSHIGLGMPLGAKPLVKEIILAAPDIDRDVFLNVADAVTRTGQRVTLYASNRDRALKASKAAHGFPRLGDATGGVTVFAGAESIDASVVGEEILAHSYYGETSVLCDLYYLISQSASPNHRFGLIAQGTPPNNGAPECSHSLGHA